MIHYMGAFRCVCPWAQAEELAAALVAEVAPPRVGARGSLRVTTMVAVAVVIVVVAATAR